MADITEPNHNTKNNDDTIWTRATIRLLVLNFVLLLLIAAGLIAVFAGLGRGFWAQVGQVFF